MAPTHPWPGPTSLHHYDVLSTNQSGFETKIILDLQDSLALKKKLDKVSPIHVHVLKLKCTEAEEQDVTFVTLCNLIAASKVTRLIISVGLFQNPKAFYKDVSLSV